MWSPVSALVLMLSLTSADDQGGVADTVTELHTIRVCVSSQPEGDSCNTLQNYYSNHSRVRVTCQSFQQCCRDFELNKVDVVSLNPDLINNYNQLFRKDAYQQIDDTKEAELPLVIVNKTSTIEGLLGVRIEKACISSLRDIPSWWITYVLAMTKANHGRYNKPYSQRNKMGITIGDIIDDPLACLGSDDKGVAIIAQGTAIKKFAEGPQKAEDYQLVGWPRGGRRPVTEYSTCNAYGINFAGESSEIERGKEILKSAAHLSLRYSQIDYFDLLYNYKGDFKVFFSDEKSAADLMYKEFYLNYYP